MSAQIKYLHESDAVVLDISAGQAEALNAIGRQMVGDKKWWGSPDEDNDEGAPSRTVIRCDPAIGGGWKLAVGDVVGVVAVPGLQVIVEPKIPLEHFIFLLELTDEWPRMDPTNVFLGEKPHFLDLLAHWYLNSLADVLRKDLIRDYRPAIADLTAIRGRLDVLPTAALYYSGRLLMACEYEEFDTDTPLNRILKAAARAVVGNPVIRAELRHRGTQVLARMDEVGDLIPSDLSAAVDPRTAHYRDALLLGRHVLRWTGRWLGSGATLSGSFLIRTPDMVEDGLRQLLIGHFKSQCKVVKKQIAIGGAPMTLNPDLTFPPLPAVADVKYRLAKAMWSRTELYQAVAFATGAKFQDASVMTFRREDTPALPTVRVGDVSVCQICWRADPDLPPEVSAERFLRDCATWLSTVPVSATIA